MSAATPASPLQFAANQANAQRSTGPSTPEGKLAAARNALSHGLTATQALLPTEDPAAYQSHHKIYIDFFRPQDDFRRQLVVELADLKWRLRRLPSFETRLVAAEAAKLASDPDLQPLLEGLDSESAIAFAYRRLLENKVLTNLHIQEARLANRANRILKQLAAKPTWEQLVTAEMSNRKNEPNSAPAPAPTPPQPIRVEKTGRNEPCPCLSGLKFKRCCLNPQPSQNVAAEPDGN